MQRPWANGISHCRLASLHGQHKQQHWAVTLSSHTKQPHWVCIASTSSQDDRPVCIVTEVHLTTLMQLNEVIHVPTFGWAELCAGLVVWFFPILKLNTDQFPWKHLTLLICNQGFLSYQLVTSSLAFWLPSVTNSSQVFSTGQQLSIVLA